MGQGLFEVEALLAPKRSTLGTRKPRGTYILLPETDEEERFEVPAAVARALVRKLEAGEINPDSRAEALWHLSEVAEACAVRRVEDLLNRRDYSEGEIRRKLREDGYSTKTIDAVVDRARAGRALDDARFADTFIRSKVNAGWGRQRIERELAQRGIEAESVEGWPEEFLDLGSESDRAYELASRRRLTGTNDYAKLMRFLVSRGFSMGEAGAAVKRILAEAQAEDEG